MYKSEYLTTLNSKNIPTHATEHHENILAIQTEFTYRQLVGLSILNVIGCLLLAWIMWGMVPSWQIVTWFLLVLLATSIVTPILLFLNKRAPIEKRYSKPWRVAVIALAFFRGSIIGCCSFWFLYVPDSTTYHVILMVAMVGAAAMAAMTTTAYRPAFFAVTFTLLTPMIIGFSIEPDLFHHLLALATVFFLVAFIFLNGKIYRSMKNSLYLQFELERQKQAAEDAKRVQTQFLAAASHDLRQPLHAHGLLVSTLKQKITDPESSRILEVLEKSMHNMQGLLNSLLDISKLDAGALIPEISDFNLQPLLQQLFLDYEAEADIKRLKFALHSNPTIISSDKALLERILRNLISNAIRYTEHGSVLVAARYRDDKVRIEVRDSGSGIDPKNHEIIFREFQQAPHKNNPDTAGLGLGLAIVSRLAKLLNHEIEVKSALGRGSIFAIEVPSSLTSPTDSPIEDISFSNDDLANTTVLVVDDEPAILEGMRNILNDWHCQAYTASSYDEAVVLLDSKKLTPDFAIVDYRLREMNGIELMQRLNNKFHIDVPTIIITGDTAPERLQEIYSSGHHALHKPVPPAKLRALMSHLLRSKK